MKKILKWIGVVIVLILFLAFVCVEITFGGRLRTIGSVKKITEYPSYEMDYYNDYSLDELLTKGITTFPKLTGYIKEKIGSGLPVDMSKLGIGCSSFSAVNEQGEAVLGRNFDYDEGIPLIVHTAPKDGYESISMVSLSFLGLEAEPQNVLEKMYFLAAPYLPLDGMNEKGVCASVLQLNGSMTNQQQGKTGITTTVAIRMILDKAATTDEAIELLKQYDMVSLMYVPYHFMISDASGKSVIVEYKNNEMQVYEKDGTYQACTNFWLYDMYKGNTVECSRYEILTRELKATDGVVNGISGGMQLLSDCRGKAKSEYRAGTIWSAFYNQSSLTMNLCIGQDYNNVLEYNVDYDSGFNLVICIEIVLWSVFAAIFIGFGIIELQAYRQRHGKK